MAWSEGLPYIFDTKNKGKIIVPPVVKLRHEKVVVSRQYPRKKPVSGMHSSRIASYAFFFFFPEKIFWRNIRGAVSFIVAVVPESVAVVICRSSASGRVGT